MAKFVYARFPDRWASGFTLLEVLVALAVLAIALTATARVFWQGTDVTAALRERTLAMWVAQDRLTRHQALQAWPDVDDSTGERVLAGWTWYWRERVSGTDEPMLRRVEIEVSRRPDGKVLARLIGVLRKVN